MLLFLICLIGLLIGFPFIHEYFSNYLFLIELLFTILMIAGIFVVSTNKQVLTITPLLALLACVVIWFNFILESPALLMCGLVLEIGFFSLTTFVIISHVLEYKHVTSDKILGAVSAYLLLAVIWAMIYTLIEIAFPHSFYFAHGIHFTGHNLSQHRFYFSEFLYFSYVTLSTLGYGDITPISNEARALSSLEAVCGQLYVAVLIARLVGLHITHTHWEQRQKEEKKISKGAEPEEKQ
jgi:hypothetical protein